MVTPTSNALQKGLFSRSRHHQTSFSTLSRRSRHNPKKLSKRIKKKIVTQSYELISEKRSYKFDLFVCLRYIGIGK